MNEYALQKLYNLLKRLTNSNKSILLKTLTVDSKHSIKNSKYSKRSE